MEDTNKIIPPVQTNEVDEERLIEYNTWVQKVVKDLARYPASLQVQASNYIYTNTYERLEADVNAQKASLTVAEKTFSGLLFKVHK